MNRQYLLLYFFVLSIPLLLGLAALQSNHYMELEKDVRRLEAAQEEWVRGNKNLIALITELSSSVRIEELAVRDLGLSRIAPENVLQVRIERGEGH